MDQSKLFRVLVVGGAMLGAACQADTSGADAALADGAALEECGFCPNECCVPDGAGGSHEREGFICCWATSC